MVENIIKNEQPNALPSDEIVFNSFYRFVSRTDRIMHITRLSIDGVAGAVAHPRLARVLHKSKTAGDKSPTDENVSNGTEYSKEFFDRIDSDAEFAQSEIDSNFSIHYAQAAVSIWSALESTFRHFWADWLSHYPAAYESMEISKIKISIGDYQTFDEIDRRFYIVDCLEKNCAATLKTGVSRFEPVNKVFLFGGETDSEIKKVLHELAQCRNLLMHRDGVVDNKFIAACPWINLSVGEEILVTQDKLYKFYASTREYAASFIERAEIRTAEIRAAGLGTTD